MDKKKITKQYSITRPTLLNYLSKLKPSQNQELFKYHKNLLESSCKTTQEREGAIKCLIDTFKGYT